MNTRQEIIGALTKAIHEAADSERFSVGECEGRFVTLSVEYIGDDTDDVELEFEKATKDVDNAMRIIESAGLECLDERVFDAPLRYCFYLAPKGGDISYANACVGV